MKETKNTTHRYLDILERSQSGTPVSNADWDYEYIMMNVRRLVKKYALTWSKEEIIPVHPDIADRVFQAGLELVQQTGIYYPATGRIISLEAEEMSLALQNMPGELELGEGKDTRLLYPRRISDPRPPIVWAGNPGVPTPEDLFLPMVMSWMQEPIVDLATCGSLTQFDGYQVRTGEPAEILATRKELRLLREALVQVGRPGMGLLAAQSSVSELGDLAVSHPDFLRPCDAHLIALLNEMKIDQNNVTRVVNSLDYGMHNASLATVMVGGLAGDAPGAAVLQTAAFIAANIICQADYHLLHPIHIRHVATSTRSVMWVQAVVEQAFARNAPAVIVSDIYPKSGALTLELLYEVAANAIVITVCGGHLEGVGAADGALPNSTGLECRWMGEIGHSVARQNPSIETANQWVLWLLEKYEHVFDLPNGNPGVRFDQAYNLDTLSAKPAWLDMYEKAKAELAGIGLSVF